MFENLDTPRPEIFLAGGEPIEFTHNGQRFRIHSVLSSWHESGGWWNRASDGFFRPDDGSRILWRVEAAPIGVMKTFEIERLESVPNLSTSTTPFGQNPFGQTPFHLWRIRPTSRPA